MGLCLSKTPDQVSVFYIVSNETENEILQSTLEKAVDAYNGQIMYQDPYMRNMQHVYVIFNSSRAAQSFRNYMTKKCGDVFIIGSNGVLPESFRHSISYSDFYPQQDSVF